MTKYFRTHTRTAYLSSKAHKNLLWRLAALAVRGKRGSLCDGPRNAQGVVASLSRGDIAIAPESPPDALRIVGRVDRLG